MGNKGKAKAPSPVDSKVESEPNGDASGGSSGKQPSRKRRSKKSTQSGSRAEEAEKLQDADPPRVVPALPSQRRRVKRVQNRADRKMKEDSTWYVIPRRWLRKWKKLVLWGDEDSGDDQTEDSHSESSNDSTSSAASSSSDSNNDPSADRDQRKSRRRRRRSGKTVVAELPPIDTRKLLDSRSRKLLDQHLSSESSGDLPYLWIDRAMVEGLDFELVNKPVWKLLSSWYGCSAPLPRTVILIGDQDEASVELWPLELHIGVCSLKDGSYDKDAFLSVIESKSCAVSGCMRRAADQFEINKRATLRLWSLDDEDIPEKVRYTQRTSLYGASIQGDQLLLIEQRNDKTREWPFEKRLQDLAKPQKQKWYKNIFSAFSRDQNPEPSTEVESGSGGSGNGNGNLKHKKKNQDLVLGKGLVGMSNLGNTCFMNSAVQCLGHVPSLRDFFAGSAFKAELNTTNPIGMKGKLAEEFGQVMNQLWTGPPNTYISPKKLKALIGKHAPQFQGYAQHDSHELLAYLLDGLHEDVNRIFDKKPVETPDYDPTIPESELAEQAWARHKMRNDSAIVDMFQGQLKSRLVCPQCSAVSVTFDPLMYLTVPLPGNHNRDIGIEVDVMFASWLPQLEAADETANSSKRKSRKKAKQDLPIRYVVRLPRSASVVDIKHALADLSKGSIDASACEVADVYNGKVYKWLADNKPVSGISSRDDIWCYCTATNDYIEAHGKARPRPRARPSERRDWLTAEMIHRRPLSRQRVELFDTPFVVHHPRRVSGRWIYECAWRVLKRFVPSWVKEHEEQIERFKRWDDQKLARSRAEKAKEKGEDNADMEIPEITEEEVEEDDYSSGGYPFVLRHVQKNGEQCAMCSKRSCLGCDLRCSGSELRFRIDSEFHSLAVDWDEAVLDEHWSESAADMIFEHASVGAWAEEEERRKSERTVTASLSECFELFTADEKLSRNDMWRCVKCKQEVQADKKFDIWWLPDAFIVHLKRFSAAGFSSRSKVATFVDFPLDGLDMSDWIQRPADADDNEEWLYDCVAVSNHMGGLGGGHYTAFARDLDQNKWYLFDDSRVSATKASNVVTKAAYMLVYVRRKKGTKVVAVSNGTASRDDASTESRSQSSADTNASSASTDTPHATPPSYSSSSSSSD